MDRNNSNDRTTAGVVAAIAIIATIALLALAGLGGVSCAAEGENAGGREGEIAGAAVSAASVTNSINYQGRLTDSSGNPLTGTHTMTFGLYDISTGGTALATDIHDVVVTDGLFNTGIDFDQSHFDGRELWLGVKVGADSEMMPRQELRPVPYALSLVPGARIIGSAPAALYAETTHWYGSGISGCASATSGYNRGVMGASRSSDGYGGYFYNNGGGIGVCGKGDEYGGYFTTNQGGTLTDRNAGVNATTTHRYSDGVHAFTSGYDSEGVYAHTTGNYSEGVWAYTTGDDSDGVYAYTTGYDSEGVYAYTTGNDSEGVYAKTTGNDSDGVYAKTTGVGSKGVYAKTTGDGSDGVHAQTTGNDSDGVYAKTTGYDSEGVHAQTTGNYSEGVWAYTTGKYSGGVYACTSGDSSEGVHAQTTGNDSEGVYAKTTGVGSKGVYAYTTGNDSDGVYAYTWGDNSDAVHAYSAKGYGVYGKGKYGGYFTTNQGGSGWYNKTAGMNATTTHDCSDGVRAYTTGDYSFGVYAYSRKSHAIYADTNYGTYGVVTPDKMCAMSYDTSCADVAEYFSTPEDPEPGTVMVIDPAGGSKLMSSTKAYDTTVAGIVSTAPGVSLGTKEDGNDGEKLIAVAGRVPCKVDASYAAIKPGDLLTTSDTPGYAMKAQPVEIGGIEIYRPGTTIGKALAPLDAGTGTIEVLVTLQ
jgi:hypothetical protein